MEFPHPKPQVSSSNRPLPSPRSSSSQQQQQKQQQQLQRNPQRQQQPPQQLSVQDQPSGNQFNQSPKPKQRQSIAQKKPTHIPFPSEQPLTIHLRTHPSPPVKPKHRHDNLPQNHSRHQHHHHHHLQQAGRTERQPPPQPPLRIHLQLNNQTAPPITLSSKKPKPEVPSFQTMTSLPTGTGGAQTTGNSSSHTRDQNDKTCPSQDKTRKSQHQNASGSNRLGTGTPRYGKTSKNSVGASETEQPKPFGGNPDSKKDASGKSTQKLPHHDLQGIPQTNLSVGLIVFCCFNPLFGALAIYLSLMAAKAYRDGQESKGNSRAHWSILVSLFGITVTMVIVSVLVVVFSVSKPSTKSSQNNMGSKLLGF